MKKKWGRNLIICLLIFFVICSGILPSIGSSFQPINNSERAIHEYVQLETCQQSENWLTCSYGTHTLEPPGTGDLYCFADCITGEEASYFTTALDLTGQNIIYMDFAYSFAGTGVAVIVTYSGGIGVQYYEETLFFLNENNPAISTTETLVTDVSNYYDVSAVYFEFYYFCSYGSNDPPGFAIDDLSITQIGYFNSFEVFNGKLSGYVTDEDMNPVEGACIRVGFHATYEENYSDENGFYVVDNIPICYCYKNVSCSKVGYKTEYVDMPIYENSTYDFVLEYVGGALSIDGVMGENGWFVDPVLITFTYNSSVIEAIYFKIDTGEWMLYTESYTYDEESVHDLSYYMVLVEGGTSDVFGPFDFKIDYTLPVIADVEVEKMNWNTHKLTADVEDEVSGIQRVEFYLDGVFQESLQMEPWEFMWSGTGQHTVQIFVFDYAGLQTNSSLIVKTIRTDLISTVFAFPQLLLQLIEKIFRTIGLSIFLGFC